MGGVVRRRESQIFIGHQRGACTVCTVCQCVSLVRASGRSVVGRERHRLWSGTGLDGVGCALARGLPLCHAYLSNSDYVFTWQCRLSIAL